MDRRIELVHPEDGMPGRPPPAGSTRCGGAGRLFLRRASSSHRGCIAVFLSVRLGPAPRRTKKASFALWSAAVSAAFFLFFWLCVCPRKERPKAKAAETAALQRANDATLSFPRSPQKKKQSATMRHRRSIEAPARGIRRILARPLHRGEIQLPRHYASESGERMASDEEQRSHP